MTWIVGIDEAGYGPNLGPFVMTAVACNMPDAHAKTDLWQVFQKVARRHTDPADSRFVVADSKIVFSQSRGLPVLEETAHAAIRGGACSKLADVVDRLAPACHSDLRHEIWYTGTTGVPVAADTDACLRGAGLHGGLCTDLGIHWGPVCSAIVCPAAFNRVLDRCNTKGAVLAASLVQLLRSLPPDDSPAYVFIDKHGGRNAYAGVLQPAFDDGLVMARAEGSLRSTYEVQDGKRFVQVTIEPRADANHFCVAMASMVSKYLREVMMMEFNRFWLSKVPGLTPTAGYPGDSTRFWNDIQDAVGKLAVEEDTLWRRK